MSDTGVQGSRAPRRRRSARGRAVGAPHALGRPAAARARPAGDQLAEHSGPATAALPACGHWAAAARPVLPRVAGAAGVPYRVAGPVPAVPGTAWPAAVVLLGNRVDALVLTSTARVPVAVVGALLAGLVVHARRRR